MSVEDTLHTGISAADFSALCTMRCRHSRNFVNVARFDWAKKLIDSRPRSPTLTGFPVDVSRLPPVPLSNFLISAPVRRRVFGSADHSGADRTSDRAAVARH